jgi:hypothetical protein
LRRCAADRSEQACIRRGHRQQGSQQQFCSSTNRHRPKSVWVNSQSCHSHAYTHMLSLLCPAPVLTMCVCRHTSVCVCLHTHESTLTYRLHILEPGHTGDSGKGCAAASSRGQHTQTTDRQGGNTPGATALAVELQHALTNDGWQLPGRVRHAAGATHVTQILAGTALLLPANSLNRPQAGVCRQMCIVWTIFGRQRSYRVAAIGLQQGF